MAGHVHGASVRERTARVRQIGERLHARFCAAQLGTVHDALTLEDGAVALTGHYCKVRIPAGRPRNTWVRLRISAVEGGFAGDVLGEE
jgi:hypothetical protein